MHHNFTESVTQCHTSATMVEHEIDDDDVHDDFVMEINQAQHSVQLSHMINVTNFTQDAIVSCCKLVSMPKHNLFEVNTGDVAECSSKSVVTCKNAKFYTDHHDSYLHNYTDSHDITMSHQNQSCQTSGVSNVQHIYTEFIGTPYKFTESDFTFNNQFEHAYIDVTQLSQTSQSTFVDTTNDRQTQIDDSIPLINVIDCQLDSDGFDQVISVNTCLLYTSDAADE